MLGPRNTAADVAILLEEGLRNETVVMRRPEDSFRPEATYRESVLPGMALGTAFGFLAIGCAFLVGNSFPHFDEIVRFTHLDKIANLTYPDKIAALARAFIDVAALLFGGYEATRIFKGRVGR
ncbi:MAG TPA: hypothetical protein VNU44_04315 [Bryobacteraceae bacterium]|jgi:hypothetical protein|nr:hypothetical protein [Bryobacteraceae bacterium]